MSHKHTVAIIPTSARLRQEDNMCAVYQSICIQTAALFAHTHPATQTVYTCGRSELARTPVRLAAVRVSAVLLCGCLHNKVAVLLQRRRQRRWGSAAASDLLVHCVCVCLRVCNERGTVA